MKTPTINLENLSCAIRCCVSSSARDESDGQHKERESGPDSFETNLHGSEEPGEFFFPDETVQGSQENSSRNTVEGRDGVVGNPEVLHSPSSTENKVQKEESGH